MLIILSTSISNASTEDDEETGGDKFPTGPGLDWEIPSRHQLFVNGTFVGGCDITVELHNNGELEKILSEISV